MMPRSSALPLAYSDSQLLEKCQQLRQERLTQKTFDEVQYYLDPPSIRIFELTRLGWGMLDRNLHRCPPAIDRDFPMLVLVDLAKRFTLYMPQSQCLHIDMKGSQVSKRNPALVLEELVLTEMLAAACQLKSPINSASSGLRLRVSQAMPSASPGAKRAKPTPDLKAEVWLGDQLRPQLAEQAFQQLSSRIWKHDFTEAVGIAGFMEIQLGAQGFWVSP